MNYHLELKRLTRKYGHNPETKQCLDDTLRVFRAFTTETLEAFTKAIAKQHNQTKTGENRNDHHE